MLSIKNFIRKKKYQKLLSIIKANSTTSYGGNMLYNGKRYYLQQVPEELAATLTFFIETFKEKIINYCEIGTAANLVNSLFYNELKIKQNVIIDNLMLNGISECLLGNLSYKQNSVFLIGNTNSDLIKETFKNISFKYDIMFLDACHEYEYVRHDFLYYSQFISSKGFIIFHDIDSWRVPGVKKFILELDKSIKQKKTDFKKIAVFQMKGYQFDAGIAIYQKC